MRVTKGRETAFYHGLIVGSVSKADAPVTQGFSAVLVPISARLAPIASLFVLVIWGM